MNELLEISERCPETLTHRLKISRHLIWHQREWRPRSPRLWGQKPERLLALKPLWVHPHGWMGKRSDFHSINLNLITTTIDII